MSYWDTSALAKLFVRESDTAVFRKLATTSAPIVTATVGRLEMRTFLRRREAEMTLGKGGSGVLYAKLMQYVARGRLKIQRFDAAVESEFVKVLETCFSNQPPVFIRTNDALHIASAIVSGESDFVTADARQRQAAELMGLTVMP